MHGYYVITTIILGAASLQTTQLWSQQVQPGQAGTATDDAVPADTSDVPGTVGTGDEAVVGDDVPGQAGTGAGIETAPGNNIQFDGFNGNPWFSDMGAQEQLQINPEQYEQLLGVYQDAWQRYQQGLRRLPRNLTGAQRMQRMQALQARFYETYNRALDANLTDPQMRQRYDQLKRQYQMFGAFNDPQLQQGMNLTAAQRRQLNQMGGRWNQQMERLRRQAVSDPEGVNQQFSRMQAQARQQMGTVFTPQQQQVWAQNTGANYSFPWPVYNNPAGVVPKGAGAGAALRGQVGAPAGGTGNPGASGGAGGGTGGASGGGGAGGGGGTGGG